ncbi:MAG: response regulator [Deltaproteobacteria bacterium]|nr:response regulator [Deltaproteobacteria bacterium]
MPRPPQNYLEAELYERIRSEPRLFDWLQDGSLDGVWYWDLEHPENEWLSPSFWRLFGIDPATKEHKASEWQDLINPDDLRVAIENFQRHCADPSHPYDQLVRYRHADGSTVWVRCRGLAIRDEAGRPVRMLGAHNDVTALKRGEAALQAAKEGLERQVDERTASLRAANDRLLTEMAERATDHKRHLELERAMLETQKLETLGVFAGGIAHDFNNMLMGILGNADLALLELAATSRAAARVAAIKTTATHLAELTNQLLAYSGKGRFLVQPVNLSELVAEMRLLLDVTIPRNVVIRADLPPGLPRVEADPSQLRQIVLNLLTNAADAIGGRSGTIAIRTGAQDLEDDFPAAVRPGVRPPGGAYVFVEVSDDGQGMDADTRERIFDPFFTTKAKGRGLGLAAVQGIVRGHGGAIRVYSEVGKGTTFKVLLPAMEGDHAPLAPEVAASGRVAHGTILVVDDEQTVRDVVQAMLETDGYTAVLAADGVEGVEAVRTRGGEFDLVLLDLSMPRLGGIEAFTEMRRLRPDLRVLLSSGYNHQDATSHFAGRGLAGFIQKPFDFARLRETLAKVLGSPPGPASGNGAG